jgi:hypothetical protein
LLELATPLFELGRRETKFLDDGDLLATTSFALETNHRARGALLDLGSRFGWWLALRKVGSECL